MVNSRTRKNGAKFAPEKAGYRCMQPQAAGGRENTGREE
jgi:hypothetical protein